MPAIHCYLATSPNCLSCGEKEQRAGEHPSREGRGGARPAEGGSRACPQVSPAHIPCFPVTFGVRQSLATGEREDVGVGDGGARHRANSSRFQPALFIRCGPAGRRTCYDTGGDGLCLGARSRHGVRDGTGRLLGYGSARATASEAPPVKPFLSPCRRRRDLSLSGEVL